MPAAARHRVRSAPCILAAVAAVLVAAGPSRAGEPRSLVLVAGPGSHAYGSHEHAGGMRLLGDAIAAAAPEIRVTVREGWPPEADALAEADGIAFFCDGGPGSLVTTHLRELRPAMERGAGLALIHWALDVPAEAAADTVLRWTGGYYETHWSVNPTWRTEFASLPKHPVCKGVHPFSLADEWYFHMRFVPNMTGVTPLLTAIPPDAVRDRPDGAHSGNPSVRARRGIPEHVAWAYVRPDGGRGFGFTGGHSHWNWAQDDMRTLVLNALVWITGTDVPDGGVPSQTPDLKRLMDAIGKPPPPDWDRTAAEQRLREHATGAATP